MCMKWFLTRLVPHSPLPHLKRLVYVYEMVSDTFSPSFPTSQFKEVSLYGNE